jgi:hypothetical protein
MNVAFSLTTMSALHFFALRAHHTFLIEVLFNATEVVKNYEATTNNATNSFCTKTQIICPRAKIS